MNPQAEGAMLLNRIMSSRGNNTADMVLRVMILYNIIVY